MASRQELKQRAKAQLGNSIFGNSWMMALLILFVEGAIISVASTTGILSIIIVGPLAVGVAGAFLNNARTGNSIDVAEMFTGFSDDFGGNLLLGLMIDIFTFLWSLLFIIPGIVKTYAYSFAYYIKSDNPYMDWNSCIKESMAMTKGYKWDLFVLDLSFIGWYIVGSLCLGVGVLWVAPYHAAAKAQFYEEVKRTNAQQF